MTNLLQPPRPALMPAPMPAPTPFLTSTQPIPALALFPLNDTFIPKYIHLNQRVKIGRQTNAKTTPGERNGYFDSKVLSRQHAEVWEEDGKVRLLCNKAGLFLILGLLGRFTSKTSRAPTEPSSMANVYPLKVLSHNLSN